jgi:hypothetical protein
LRRLTLSVAFAETMNENDLWPSYNVRKQLLNQ